MVGGASGEGHVGEAGVLAAGGGHGGAVGAEDVFGAPDLVVFVEDGFLGGAAHAGGAHFVDAEADGGSGVACLDVFGAHRLEHFGGVVFHVSPHLELVFLEGGVGHDEGETPLVGFVGGEGDAVVLVGEALSESADADSPGAEGGEFLFEVRAESTDAPGPSGAHAFALIAEAADVVAGGLLGDVAVAGDVDPAGAPAVVDGVLVGVEVRAGSDAEVVVHEVAAEGAALVHAIGEALGLGVHEDGGGGDGGGVEEDDLGVVFGGLHGDLVDEADADGLVLFVVEDDGVDDGVGAEGHVAGSCGSGEGGGLAAEVGAEGATADAEVAEHAGAAAEGHLFRGGFGEVGDAGGDEFTSAPFAFDG